MGNGNLVSVLQVKTETAILAQKKKKEEERQEIAKKLEAICNEAAENGIDFAKINYPIELENATVTQSSIKEFANNNRLLIIKKEVNYITLSWKISRKNRIKDFFYKLTIK